MNVQPQMPLPGVAPASPAAPAKRRWQDDVPTSARVPVLLGLAVTAAFVLGFGLWAATAPISGAVVAVGIVQASGQNQVVDHLEGGIIAEILVAEGDVVDEGEVLMRLDTTRTIAERNRVASALLSVEAQLVRSEAERDGLEQLAFGPELEDRARLVDGYGSLDEQRSEFRNRLERHKAEMAALELRVQAAHEEIEGLAIQKESEERKLAVTREELADKKTLLDRGLTPRSQYQALQRAEADSLGRIGALAASMGQRRSSIAELAEQQAGLEATRREAAAAQINELRARLADLREQLRSREDVLARSAIRAPAPGIIVELAKNTVGSSVRPGEAVAELLPTASDLQIQVRVAPHDIDQVKIGQQAVLRLTALNARTTPDVPARVTYLSADRLVDEATREPFFTARLEIEGELPPGVAAGQIYPGMPVDALIQTGERTFFEYLVRPVQDSFAKAFRED